MAGQIQTVTVQVPQRVQSVAVQVPHRVQVVEVLTLPRGPVGPAGPAGPPGPGSDPLFSIVAAEDLAAGQPVYVAPILGQLKLATAAVFAASSVAGLAQVATLATFATPLATTTLALTDWTAITGVAVLTKGARYFLGLTPGTLSIVAPAIPGQSSASIGIAISTTQLKINPSPPILL